MVNARGSGAKKRALDVFIATAAIALTPEAAQRRHWRAAPWGARLLRDTAVGDSDLARRLARGAAELLDGLDNFRASDDLSERQGELL